MGYKRVLLEPIYCTQCGKALVLTDEVYQQYDPHSGDKLLIKKCDSDLHREKWYEEPDGWWVKS